jgi:hypothetical protein
VPDTDTTNSADNAKALVYTSAGVAGFRATKTTTTLTISGTVTVNGVAKAGVTISGASCTTSGTNGVYRCTVSSGFSGVLTPSYVLNSIATKFSPVSRSYSRLSTSATNQNFAGIR